MRNRRTSRRRNGSLTARPFQLENLEDRRLMAGVTAASNLDSLMPPPAPEGEPQMIVQDSGGGNADFSFSERLAYRWAPIHRQDVAQSSGDGIDGKADYISAINFDGDWDTRNNWENAETFQNSLAGHAYYSVSETSTHWHIVYGFFHARDWATGPGANLDTHENDMEGLVSVVRKPSDPAGNPYGQLEAMTTVSHNDFYTFTDEFSGFVNGEQGIDGEIQYRSHDGEDHPITEQEAKGHGLKAWTGSDFNSFPGNDGVVYYPSLTTAEVPSSQNDRFVRYKLVDIFEEGGLYDRRGQSETFVSDGLFHQTNGGGGNAKAPWKWDDTGGILTGSGDDGSRLPGGELATDPARLTSIYLDNLGVWRETYLTNQYRGIEPAAPGIDYVQPTVRSYIPPGIAGDDEFGGNGPQIVSTASLRVRPNGEGLDTQLFMQAAEVGGDSIAAGTQAWSQQWFAPSHQGVASFYGSNSGSVVYVDDDHDMDDFLFSQDGSLFDRNGIVQRMSFVGDTSGDDIGETRVDAYFNRVEVSLYTELGDTEDGLATQDGATGQGYAMYSQENVFNRFAANPPYDDTLGRNSENIIAVKYFNDQWHYDNNSTYVPFTPEPSDILIASLDFDADQIMSLEGVDEIENGIVKGFEGGNLNFEADQFGGVFNNGEFTITGSQLFPNRELVDIGPVNAGIAATDAATGTGFVLYSEENLFTRFSEAQPFFNFLGSSQNSEHLIAVTQIGNDWFYDNNSNYVPFTPRPSDVLLASVDFTNNDIISLEGTDDIVDGIAAGYAVGDLTFEADVLNGVANNDEFTVSGTTFVRNHELSSLGQTNRGIAVTDGATGEGYVLFSETPVSSRFGAASSALNRSDRLIAVRYENGSWQQNDNETWTNFTPEPSDVLVAQVDFDNDTIMGLEGANGSVHGIARGYDVGDLTFEADKYGGLNNNGEFTVRGTQFFRGATTYADFDGDGDFDLDDADELSLAISGGSNSLAYDINADGIVSPADMSHWVTDVKGTLVGDANLDFTVDGQDFIVWNNNKFQPTGRWSQGDFNADGVTDGLDFVVWNNSKFQSADTQLSSQDDDEREEERRVSLVDDLFAALA